MILFYPELVGLFYICKGAAEREQRVVSSMEIPTLISAGKGVFH